MSETATPYWWQREDLIYQNGNLHFAGHDVQGLAEMHGTPTFFYSAKRLTNNVRRLHTALQNVDLQDRYR